MNNTVFFSLTYVLLAGVTASAKTETLLADGFGDGDRDNDGRRVEQIENREDVGVPWFMSRGTGDFLLSIADDRNGIGAGNALGVSVTRGTSRSVGARFREVELQNVGDRLSLSFDVRVVTPLEGVEHERRFRFGLYHDGGTPVEADTKDEEVTKDDVGYFLQMDVGTPEGTTADFRGNHNNMLLGGSYNQSFGGKTDDALAALSDNAKHSVRLTILRVEDDEETHAASDYQFELVIDGENVISRRLSQGAQDAVTERFNTVYFGTSNVVLEYRLDNIVVEAGRED